MEYFKGFLHASLFLVIIYYLSELAMRVALLESMFGGIFTQ